jgi:hypothetical protein
MLGWFGVLCTQLFSIGTVPMAPIDEEIKRVKAAAVRHRKSIDAMEAQWSAAGGTCCASCMFGSEFSSIADKAERTNKWLCVLLRKRNGPDDESLAKAIEMSAWP